MGSVEEGVLNHPFFIGSVIVDNGVPHDFSGPECIEYLFDKAARLSHLEIDGTHLFTAPQLPQLNLKGRPDEYGMNGEALIGMPFLEHDQNGNHNLTLVVDPDDDHGNGAISGTEEELTLFGSLNLQIAELTLANQENKPQAELDGILDSILRLYADIGRLPPGINASLREVSRQKDHLINTKNDHLSSHPVVFKYQFSGYINTASEIYVTNSKGKRSKGALTENSTMLNFHSGLLFASSLIWAREIRTELSGLGIKAQIIGSSDEPIFETLDPQSKFYKEVVLPLYETFWGKKNTYYDGMIHVCGNFLPDLLKLNQLTYLNFDALHKGNLLKSHVGAIQKFFENGGYLVLGLTPANLNEIEEFDKPLLVDRTKLGIIYHQQMVIYKFMRDQQLKQPGQASQLIAKYNRIISSLVSSTMSESFVREHCLISPTCGFGGMSKIVNSMGKFLTARMYILTKQLEKMRTSPTNTA